MKIKNLIGNNPYKVKNYVQGDEMDNDLMPLKLLQPKQVKFNNDDEFIEHFLMERKKKEKAERMAHMKKIKKAGGLSSGFGKSAADSVIKKSALSKMTHPAEIKRQTGMQSTLEEIKRMTSGLEKQSESKLTDAARISEGYGIVTEKGMEEAYPSEDYEPTTNLAYYQEDNIFGSFNKEMALLHEYKKLQASSTRRLGLNQST